MLLVPVRSSLSLPAFFDLWKALIQVKAHTRKDGTQVKAHQRNVQSRAERRELVEALAHKMAGGAHTRHATLASAVGAARYASRANGKAVHVYEHPDGGWVATHDESHTEGHREKIVALKGRARLHREGDASRSLRHLKGPIAEHVEKPFVPQVKPARAKKERPAKPAPEAPQRYTYGLQMRPAAPGAVPKGYVGLEPSEHFRHGLIHYDRELTPDEVRGYELDHLTSQGRSVKNEDAKAAWALMGTAPMDLNPEYLEATLDMAQEDHPAELPEALEHLKERRPDLVPAIAAWEKKQAKPEDHTFRMNPGDDMEGESFGHGQYPGAQLAGVNLQRATFQHANLAGANLKGANLREADMTQTDLAGADLSGAELVSADMTRANLAGANLGGANLLRADLSGANLTNADLRGANLQWANLDGADLTGAKLDGATGINRDAPGLKGVEDEAMDDNDDDFDAFFADFQARRRANSLSFDHVRQRVTEALDKLISTTPGVGNPRVDEKGAAVDVRFDYGPDAVRQVYEVRVDQNDKEGRIVVQRGLYKPVYVAGASSTTDPVEAIRDGVERARKAEKRRRAAEAKEAIGSNTGAVAKTVIASANGTANVYAHKREDGKWHATVHWVAGKNAVEAPDNSLYMELSREQGHGMTQRTWSSLSDLKATLNKNMAWSVHTNMDVVNDWHYGDFNAEHQKHEANTKFRRADREKRDAAARESAKLNTPKGRAIFKKMEEERVAREAAERGDRSDLKNPAIRRAVEKEIKGLDLKALAPRSIDTHTRHHDVTGKQFKMSLLLSRGAPKQLFYMDPWTGEMKPGRVAEWDDYDIVWHPDRGVTLKDPHGKKVWSDPTATTDPVEAVKAAVRAANALPDVVYKD